MRLLSCSDPSLAAGTHADSTLLRRLYAFAPEGGLRTNFVATVDGAGAGADGLTGSINNPADKIVFDLNRELADVVLAGAATIDAESYGPTAGATPLVAVSNRCLLPRGWRAGAPGPGSAILVTVKDADPAALASARAALGPDHVWTIGHGVVDLGQVVARLAAEGWTKVLCEGGPRLHTELLRRDLVDQLALTWVPHLIAGQAPRIAHGPNLTVNLTLKHLIESAGTLLTLWERRGPAASG